MTDRLETLVAKIVSDLGFDLEACELTPAGKRRVLRIAIDTNGGITIDHIAAATRELSIALDESDVMGSMPYTLEVTSRGVDRPLTLPRHWSRNRGRLVKVHLVDGNTVEGRILAAADDDVQITTTESEQTIAYVDVSKALVQIELNRKGV